MKATAELQEFRGLDAAALVQKINDTEHELMNLRFKHSTAQLEQTAQIKQLRKRIARLKTVQAEQARANESTEEKSE